MRNNNKLIALNITTKEELDELRKIYGDISYDKLITNLLIDFYKNKK